MSANTITDGPWIYSRQNSWDAWTVTDSRSGQSHDTGALTFPDARRFTYELSRRTATTVQVTIASGPQRARAGHQRYTTTFAA